MFDFEKLHVYNKSKIFNQVIKSLIGQASLDSNTRNQLRRAAYSIMLNIAEGSGRFTRADKRNFYVIARGSVYESADYPSILGLPIHELINIIDKKG